MTTAPMLVNGRTFLRGGSLMHAGCSEHNTKQARRARRKALKAAERRAFHRDLQTILADLGR